MERHSAAILRHPDGARFFTGRQILWSGNEVSVSDAGDVLRIDRLVLLEEAGAPTWWVLDYKLHQTPEERAPYRAQLLRYREIVARAQPGELVRCAFLINANFFDVRGQRGGSWKSSEVQRFTG